MLALGHCGVQFSLTRVWFPQDLQGGGATEGKGEENWEETFCVWLLLSVYLQRTKDS